MKRRMHRYKVRASDEQSYRELKLVLKGVRVFASSPRRRLFSTGELSPEVRRAVRAHGGKIVADRQYDPEARGVATG